MVKSVSIAISPSSDLRDASEECINRRILICIMPVENEYGSWPSCDHDYVNDLAKLIRQYLGSKTVLFTTDGDGDGYLKCGKTNDAYATIDFGPGDDGVGVEE